jgi:hypothetical protein
MAITSGVVLAVSLLAHAQFPKEAIKKAKPKAAAKAPAVKGELAGPVNQMDLAAQMAERYRPHLCVEYHFLRMVCGLSVDERNVLAPAAVQAFHEAIAQYEEMRRSPQLRLTAAQPRVLPDPRRLLQEGLVRAAEKHLAPERAARYREELAERSRERKRVTIERLVDWMDHELILSADQRKALTVAFTTGWDDSWFPTDVMLAMPERYISRIPRHSIALVLDGDQRKIWDQLLRNPINVTGVVMNPVLAIEFPEDEELVAARAAAEQEGEVSP